MKKRCHFPVVHAWLQVTESTDEIYVDDFFFLQARFAWLVGRIVWLGVQILVRMHIGQRPAQQRAFGGVDAQEEDDGVFVDEPIDGAIMHYNGAAGGVMVV